MSELLFEIGTEELPAGFIDPACAHLEKAIAQLLDDARLQHGKVTVDGTPRRLAVVVDDVASRQSDREEEVTGPKVEVAYAPDGSLTKAGEGFLKGKGLEAKDAFKKETKKGTVIAALVREAGKPAVDVLGPLLSDVIGKIPFAKQMRWGDRRETFGRPIQWILALLDDKPLSVSFAGVTSSTTTRGHRYHAPGPFEVRSVKEWRQKLTESQVVLERSKRKELILAGAEKLAKEAGGTLLNDPALLEIVKNLVEKPFPILGKFEARFLEMPKELLVSEMREHQKYFAIQDAKGALLSSFIVVAGSDSTDKEGIARGNARVLRSRFEDGAFYWKTDGEQSLSERVQGLSKVVFHRELGTVLEKTERIEKNTAAIAKLVRASNDVATRASRAAHLCKADLISGVVGEFPELQGVMGRYYALRTDGGAKAEPENVAWAIEEHYAPRHAGAAMPRTEEGALVGIADRLDTIAGILGIGKAPTGSADPYALRRASIAIANLVLDRGYRVSLRALAEIAAGSVEGKLKGKKPELVDQIVELVRVRLRGVLVERCEQRKLTGAEDIVDAAMGAGADDLPDLEARTVALAHMRTHDKAGFLQLAATFKRVGNILQKARSEKLLEGAGKLVAGDLKEPAERELLGAVERAKKGFDKAARSKLSGDALVAHDQKALETLASIKPAVDTFFDKVMVLVDDKALRGARLALLAQVEEMLVDLADFTRVQVEA